MTAIPERVCDTWKAEFQDAAAEREFRNSEIDNACRITAGWTLVLGHAIILTSIDDLVSFTGARQAELPFVLTLRVLLYGSCLAAAGLVWFWRKPRVLDWAVFGVVLALMTLFTILAYCYATVLGRHDNIFYYAIFSLCMFLLFPVPLRMCLGCDAVVLTCALVLNAYFLEVSAAEVIRVCLTLLLVSTLGAFVAYRMNRSRRLAFIHLRAERGARESLEDEVRQRRQAEESLQRHKAQLEQLVEERTARLEDREAQLRQAQKMEALGQLAGGIAHDFNNLLVAIQGYAELAIEETRLPEPLRQYLAEILNASQRATVLVKQLLAFGRQESVRREFLDINKVIDDTAGLIRRVIGDNIELRLELQHGLASIFIDKSQLEQVLFNLCVNARDAMPEGGTITIETANAGHLNNVGDRLTRSDDGEFVALRITDTGVGIRPEELERVFDPFFTTKPVGKGTGLGLSTVYGIVQQHDAVISVESEPGKGTSFRLLFPALKAAAAPDRDEATVAPQLGGSETILVAEDDELVRRLAISVLSQAGYRVFAAEDGEQAIRLFEEHLDEVDLLLLDVVMPKVSGQEVDRRAKEQKPRVASLFTSGYSFDPLDTSGSVGEIAFIQKPYAPTELLKKIRESLASVKGA